MSLKHLIYISTKLPECDVSELPVILETSVRNNKQQDVTGMLLYSQGHFMQVLEGSPIAVDDVYARIQKDDRHTDLIVIDERAIVKRNFAKWNMGYRMLNAQDSVDHPEWAPFFVEGFDASSIGARSGLALSLLHMFAQD